MTVYASQLLARKTARKGPSPLSSYHTNQPVKGRVSRMSDNE